MSILFISLISTFYLTIGSHIINSTGEYFIATDSTTFYNKSITCNSTINNCTIICPFENSCYNTQINTSNGVGNINLYCSSSSCTSSNISTSSNITVNCSAAGCNDLSCNTDNLCIINCGISGCVNAYIDGKSAAKLVINSASDDKTINIDCPSNTPSSQCTLNCNGQCIGTNIQGNDAEFLNINIFDNLNGSNPFPGAHPFINASNAQNVIINVWNGSLIGSNILANNSNNVVMNCLGSKHGYCKSNHLYAQNATNVRIYSDSDGNINYDTNVQVNQYHLDNAINIDIVLISRYLTTYPRNAYIYAQNANSLNLTLASSGNPSNALTIRAPQRLYGTNVRCIEYCGYINWVLMDDLDDIAVSYSGNCTDHHHDNWIYDWQIVCINDNGGCNIHQGKLAYSDSSGCCTDSQVNRITNAYLDVCPSPSEPASNNDNGLKGWEIILLVIGVGLVVVIGIVGLIWLNERRKRPSQYKEMANSLNQ